MKPAAVLIALIFTNLALAEMSDPPQACDFVLHPKTANWIQSKFDEVQTELLADPDGERIAQKIHSNFKGVVQVKAWRHGSYNYYYNLTKKFPRGKLLRSKIDDTTGTLEEVLDLENLSHQAGVKLNLFEIHFFGNRALLEITYGGSDKKSVIEFDLNRKEIVPDGFAVGRELSHVQWLNQNSILTEESRDLPLTDSQHPRELWQVYRNGKRKKLFELPENYSYMSAYPIDLGQKSHFLVSAFLNFHQGHFFWIRPNGELLELSIPWHGRFAGTLGETLIFQTTETWVNEVGTLVPIGTILSVETKGLSRGRVNYNILFQPSPIESVGNVEVGAKSIFAVVRSSSRWQYLIIYNVSPSSSRVWQSDVDGFPVIQAISELRKPLAWEVEIQDPIHAKRKVVFAPNVNGIVPLESVEKQTDLSDSFIHEQLWAPGGKGQPTPYVVFRKKGPPPTKPVPTVIYCYGGFSMAGAIPFSPIAAQEWLSKGGQIVYAMIRGGAEQGWIQSFSGRGPSTVGAIDLINVAEDLVHRHYSSPDNIGMHGASNAGRWIGLASLMRPDLFKAISLNSSVLNLEQYGQWGYAQIYESEYGLPDHLESSLRIEDYSPQHYPAQRGQLPTFLLQTAQNDERVWPEHSRQFAKKLEKLNANVYLAEHPEGGHDLSSNYQLKIDAATIQWTFFRRELGLAP